MRGKLSMESVRFAISATCHSIISPRNAKAPAAICIELAGSGTPKAAIRFTPKSAGRR